MGRLLRLVSGFRFRLFKRILAHAGLKVLSVLPRIICWGLKALKEPSGQGLGN